MKLRCTECKIEVEKINNTLRYGGEGLSWGGTPQCKLFTIRKEGRFGKCILVKAL